MKKNYIIPIFVPHLGCPNDCTFCNQKKISGQKKNITKNDVKNIIEYYLENFKEVNRNVEVAFFGGSFTGIQRDIQEELLIAANEYIRLGKVNSIRISTRPDYIDKDILKFLKRYNVETIELGVQSTNNYILNKCKRGHSYEDVKKASLLIKEYGFSLGLQMMTGLYKSTGEKDIETAKELIRLKPETVRIYPTIVLENTHLAELLQSQLYTSPTLEETVSLCAELLELFYENNIKVIRLGLHSGGNVTDGYLSGPYHPAFGELCESEIYLKKIRKKLFEIYKNENNSEIKNVTIYVNQKEISKAIGQKGKNKELLLSDGFKVTIKGKNELEKYEIETENTKCI